MAKELIEMDGASYARQRSRLCTACKGCNGCPIMEAAMRKIEDGVDAACTGCIPFERDYSEEAVAIVKKWMQEYPECGGEMKHFDIKPQERRKSMDKIALELVTAYIENHLDKSDDKPEFEVFTVWKAKILQNWKYLISSTLLDGMYYELTYNGDNREWYLDAYKKFENQVYPENVVLETV